MFFSLMAFIPWHFSHSHFFFYFHELLFHLLDYKLLRSRTMFAYSLLLCPQHLAWYLAPCSSYYLLADKGCCFIHSSPLGQTVLLIFVAFADHTSPLYNYLFPPQNSNEMILHLHIFNDVSIIHYEYRQFATFI